MKSMAEHSTEPRTFDALGAYILFLRVSALIIFLGGFYWLRGLPSEREQIIAVILVSLLILTAGTDFRKIITSVANWLPFVVLMVMYDFTRGAADDLGMPIQTQLPIVADRLVCRCDVNSWARSVVPTTPRGAYPTAYWYEAVFSVTYATHFFLPYITSAVLWLKKEERFHRFRDAFFLLTFAGLLIYVLLPTTPPWMAGEQGFIPDVTRESRTSGNGWRLLNITWAESVLDKGRAVGNPVAALPSLHAAYSLFFSLMIWPTSTWVRKVRGGFYIPGVRPILVLFPIVMLITLVVAAEHYLFDIFLGWIFAVGSVWLFSESRYRRIRAAVSGWLTSILGFRLARTPKPAYVAADPVDTIQGPVDSEPTDDTEVR